MAAGFTVAWVGLEVDVREYSLGISERRAAWLAGWFRKILAEDQVQMAELRGAVGRMTFVYGTLAFDKPFLADYWTLLAIYAPGATVRLPRFVRSVAGWLLTRLES